MQCSLPAPAGQEVGKGTPQITLLKHGTWDTSLQHRAKALPQGRVMLLASQMPGGTELIPKPSWHSCLMTLPLHQDTGPGCGLRDQGKDLSPEERQIEFLAHKTSLFPVSLQGYSTAVLPAPWLKHLTRGSACAFLLPSHQIPTPAHHPSPSAFKGFADPYGVAQLPETLHA